MTIEEGKRLLEGEGLPYIELHFENEYQYWKDVSFWDNGNRGRDEPVTVLRMVSPNGQRHLDLQFLGEEFQDLWFGGFSHELWENTEESLPGEILDCIRVVTEEGCCCVIAMDPKSGHWRGDSLWTPKEDGRGIRECLEWLRRPRTLRERFFRTQRLYELYDWNEYHRIER